MSADCSVPVQFTFSMSPASSFTLSTSIVGPMIHFRMQVIQIVYNAELALVITRVRHTLFIFKMMYAPSNAPGNYPKLDCPRV